MTRSKITGVCNCDDPIETRVIESVIHPDPCRFGADPFAPEFLDHAVTNLDLVRAVERLKPAER
jgi:hypothetical protein